MKIAFVIIAVLLFTTLCDAHGRRHRRRTALDRYVRKYDPTYDYEYVSNFNGTGFQAYVLELTSQTWLTADDSSRSVWKHWVTVCVPDDMVETNVASIFIDSGSEFTGQPTAMDTMAEVMCLHSKGMVVVLNQIPNQPITFQADPLNLTRVEDAIIAYTWEHFMLDTSQPEWLLRLPMTKAVVKCMDMIQDWARDEHIIPCVRKFVVIGASKRGWAAWTTAIVDRRVKAVVPIVIPILDMVPSINILWRSLGEWTFALNDYVSQGVIDYLNDPLFQEMADIIDPISYLNRLKMPKFVICSTKDEFFLPDSTRYFYDQLLGENYLRMIPNVGHSMTPERDAVSAAVGTWVYMLTQDIPMPDYEWSMVRSNATSGSITLVSETTPVSVKSWVGTPPSTTQRDFRQVTCPSAACYQFYSWVPEELTPEADGKTYIATVPVPAAGWTGFFIEVEYADNVKFTTEVNVLPDVWPFAQCTDGIGC